MASKLPVKVSQLKEPNEETIKQMVHIYQEAYKNDNSIQLRHVRPDFTQRMAETIASRVKIPECDFILAKSETSNQLIGWLALAYKLESNKQLSEEHVLLGQYVLLPDLVAKGKSQGIDSDEMQTLATKLFKDFKVAREKQLPDKHCILSTLVVDPAYQNQGVASALLSKAIGLTEVFLFPIWVQVPESCQSLFKRHQFEEVGEYHLDLNERMPDLEPEGKGKGKGKGKAKAEANLEKHVWKYMVRKKPLEHALEAYRSSKVFAELEEAQRMEGLGFGERMVAWVSKAFASYQMEPGPTASSLGKEKKSASEGLPLLGKGKRPESSAASSQAEVGSSAMISAVSSLKGNQKLGTKGKAVGKANVSKDSS